MALTFLLWATAIFAGAADQTARARDLTNAPTIDNRWALLIGVNRYADPTIKSLIGPENDVAKLMAALMGSAGFHRKHIVALSTSHEDVDGPPTRSEILGSLSKLASSVPADGLLLIAFSGHGIEQNGEAYLLPLDVKFNGSDINLLHNTAIALQTVRDTLITTQAHRIVVLLDACRNDPMRSRSIQSNVLSLSFVNAFAPIDTADVFAILYGAGINERAWEDPARKMGYFTAAVADALNGNVPGAPKNATLTSLIQYVQRTVPERVAADSLKTGELHSQHPYVSLSGTGNDIPLVTAQPGTSAASDLEPAAPACTAVLTPEPQNSVYRSAVADLQKRRYPKAAAKLLRCQPSFPTNGQVDYQLGVAYMNQVNSGNSASRKGELLRSARAAFFEAAVLHGPLVASWMNIADIDMKLREWPEAVTYFNRVLECDPTNVNAEYDVAASEMNLSRLPQSIAHFTLVLDALRALRERSPADCHMLQKALRDRGVAERQAGRLSLAAQDALELARLAKNPETCLAQP